MKAMRIASTEFYSAFRFEPGEEAELNEFLKSKDQFCRENSLSRFSWHFIYDFDTKRPVLFLETDSFREGGKVALPTNILMQGFTPVPLTDKELAEHYTVLEDS